MGIEAGQDYNPEEAEQRAKLQAMITERSAKAGRAAAEKREKLAMGALAREKAQELAEAQFGKKKTNSQIKKHK